MGAFCGAVESEAGEFFRPILGIHYSPTRTEDNTTVVQVGDDLMTPGNIGYSLANGGGG